MRTQVCIHLKKVLHSSFIEDLPLHRLTITPTKKKRRSDTSKMTISGMKDNPYGFGEPIDQPALSLSVSYLYNSEIQSGFLSLLSFIAYIQPIYKLQGMEDVDKFTFRTQSNTKPVLTNQTINSLGPILITLRYECLSKIIFERVKIKIVERIPSYEINAK